MNQPEVDPSNPAAGMTKSMTIMMPLMSLYFCLVTPAGLGIYWVTSALFQCIQQIVLWYLYFSNHNGVALQVKITKNISKGKWCGEIAYNLR